MKLGGRDPSTARDSFEVGLLRMTRDLLFDLAAEVGSANLNDGSSGLWFGVFFFFLALVSLRLFLFLFRRNSRLLRPDSVDSPAEGCNSRVVSEEDSAGFERLISPSVVHEIPTAIGGACQSHDLFPILRIAAAVIK